MIVHDFDTGRPGSSVRPFETDAPLLVDPDRILAAAIAAKRLQAVAGQAAQVLKRGRGIKYLEPLPSLPFKTLKRPDTLTTSKLLGAPVPVTQDHEAVWRL